MAVSRKSEDIGFLLIFYANKYIPSRIRDFSHVFVHTVGLYHERIKYHPTRKMVFWRCYRNINYTPNARAIAWI